MKKPILLIYPPFEGKNILTTRFPFPIGLLYIAAYLESKDIPCEVWDFGYPPTKRKIKRPAAIAKSGIRKWSRHGWNGLEIRRWLQNNLSRFHKVVGLSSLMSTNYTGMYMVAKLIKKVDPHRVLIAGGPHATADPAHVFDNSPVDMICSGEGEHAMYDLLREREHEAIIRRGLRTIKARQAFIKNMDELPFPKRQLLQDDRELKDMYITFSRGCPHRCTFCGSYLIQGRKWRHKTVDRAIDELRFYIKNWGVKKFIVEDDNATPGKAGIRWMKQLCTEIINSLPKIRLTISHGIPVYATADKELCFLMWHAGFRRMVFPLESSNYETLKHMNKEDTPKNYKKAIENWHYEKLKPTEIIIGYPFVETIESMLQTLIFIADTGAVSWPSHFRLNKDTPLFKACMDAGYVNSNYDTLSASAFHVGTERFAINDLQEITQIARGANYGIEHDWNCFTGETDIKTTIFTTTMSGTTKTGSVIARGKFAYNRSQSIFGAILLMRAIGLKGRPMITVADGNKLIWTGVKKSKVWAKLGNILKIEHNKNIQQYFGAKK